MSATSLAILVVSHVAAAVVGGWFWSLVLAGRAGELEGRAELLAVRETFLAGQLGVPLDAIPATPTPSLVDATVAQAMARLSELGARREQEHRQFVEIMHVATRPWRMAR